jgi:hypothetical protein
MSQPVPWDHWGRCREQTPAELISFRLRYPTITAPEDQPLASGMCRSGHRLNQCHHETIVNVDRLPGDVTVPSFGPRGVHQMQDDRRRCAAELARAPCAGDVSADPERYSGRDTEDYHMQKGLKGACIAGPAAAAVTVLVLGTVRAETPEQWVTLGARVHGAFGSFLPVGIRIGLDALERLNANPREVTVVYYDSDKAPCACVADGVAMATVATVGQRTLEISAQKASAGAMAVMCATR